MKINSIIALTVALSGTLLAMGPSVRVAERPKSPFKILYNNDLTHIRSTESPYRKGDQEFNIEMLKASVDETVKAGCDVHMLSPLLTYVPAWKSKIYPIKEHVEWLKSKYPKVKIADYVKCLAEGTDIVGVYVEYCRKEGIAPFITVRVNDWHGQEWVGSGENTEMDWFNPGALDKWRGTHPQYRMAPVAEQQAVESTLTDNRKNDLRRPGLAEVLRNQRVMNWRFDPVRERMLGFIKEICEGYDIEGLELDFMRHYMLFDDKLPSAERQKIVIDFVQRVRQMLDETARNGQYRWLCVRVPAYLSCLDSLGLDYQAMAGAGVDMFNLSANYYTVQQTDFEIIKKMLPSNKAVYIEMTQTTSKDQDVIRRGDNSAYTFRFTTPQQLWTTAHLGYNRGASGVSLFNFQYYREYGDRRPGSFQKPPFEAIRKLADPDALAQESMDYFIGNSQNNNLLGYEAMIPSVLSEGEMAEFLMDIAPPEKKIGETCRLRLQFKYPLSGQTFEVRFNGKLLNPIDDISEPFGGYNPVLTGNADTLRAWEIPSDFILDAVASIEVTQLSGKVSHLNFLDLEIK